MRLRTVDLWRAYILGKKEAAILWCPLCEIDFEMSASAPVCPICGDFGIPVLKRLDERKLKARKVLHKGNPKPRGFSEETIETAQDEWQSALDLIEDYGKICAVLGAGLRSPSRLDVWLLQGGDDWLTDYFVVRKWPLEIIWKTLAENAPSKKVRAAAKELARLPPEYAKTGREPNF